MQNKRMLLETEDVANILRDAPRIGADVDNPEGRRYIQISDTLAKQMEASLRLWIDPARWYLFDNSDSFVGRHDDKEGAE